MTATNMTATEEAHWVAMAQSGQLRRQLALFEKEVVRPDPLPAAHPPQSKKGLGLGVPAVRKPGARGVLINADQAPAKIATKIATKTHPHHWRLSEPNGPVTHGRCKACGAEREFSTAGPDVMPLTLLSKSNLAKRGLATRFKKVAG